MFARQSLIAAAVLCALAPALAQDRGDSAPFWPSPVPATGGSSARQETSQWLGANMIGARVISASNEAIGRVANLVVNEDGVIEAAVIAFGGVFGVGERNVAVTYKSLAIVRNKNGDAIDHVTLAATKSDLRHAAEFRPLKKQMAERRAMAGQGR